MIASSEVSNTRDVCAAWLLGWLCVRVCLDADNSWAGVEEGSVLRYGKCLRQQFPCCARRRIDVSSCCTDLIREFLLLYNMETVWCGRKLFWEMETARVEFIPSIQKKFFFCIYIQFFYVSFVGMPRCFSFFFNVGVKASVLLRDFMVLLEHAWSWLRRMLMKLSLQFFCFPALSFRLCRWGSLFAYLSWELHLW